VLLLYEKWNHDSNHNFCTYCKTGQVEIIHTNDMILKEILPQIEKYHQNNLLVNEKREKKYSTLIYKVIQLSLLIYAFFLFIWFLYYLFREL
jgi:hypothetical protein